MEWVRFATLLVCNRTRVWYVVEIYKPVLKLTVIHSLAESDFLTVPYLEYQITSDVAGGGYEPANSAQTIRAEGLAGTFKQVLEVKIPQETGLLEYVIQQ